MKTANKLWLSLVILIALGNFAMAQTALGSSKTILTSLKKDLINSASKASGLQVSLKVSEANVLEAKVNYKESNETTEFLIGEINNKPESSFYVRVANNAVEGHIILKATKEAYKYRSDQNGNTFIDKVDINTLICINYDYVSSGEKTQLKETNISKALLTLESLPGATGCIMLDFDGYNMPAGNLWNGGNAINAAPSGLSDADVQRSWAITAEDYRPFNVNVTTNEAVFNSYPKNRRMRAVITPTNTAAPGSGGVAYIGSFNWDNDVPCWVFNRGAKVSGETISHEIGHTFDLQHDGRTTPAETYFSGISGTPFAPIMGASYYSPVGHWSKGEYNAANNFQDDIATIAGAKFGLGYRADDYGNDIAGAAILSYNTTGAVTQKNGLITNQADWDFFTFTTGGGTVTLNVNTVPIDGNLDVIIRLYNQAGTQIGSYTNTTNAALNATLSANLAAGKYYISVDGTGAGDAKTGGYSDYASIGAYSITGTIPPAATSNLSVGGSVSPASQTIAVGINNVPTIHRVSGQVGTIVRWEYAVPGGAWTNWGGAGSNTAPSTCCFSTAGTWRVRAIVKNGASPEASSSAAQIIVTAAAPTQLIANGTYLMRSQSNVYLQVTASIGLLTSNTTENGNFTKWNFTHLGNDVYEIRSVAFANQRMEVPYGTTGATQKIAITTYTGSDNHLKWKATKVGNSLLFEPLHNLGFALDAWADNPAVVHLWDKNTANTNQLFGLIATGAASSSSLAVDENTTPLDINIFPNPSTTRIIQSQGLKKGMRYEITDMIGNVKTTKDVTTMDESIDVTHLAAGIYIININHEGQTLSKKIILQ
jgi:Secretion system C-terminal sorting domain